LTCWHGGLLLLPLYLPHLRGHMAVGSRSGCAGAASLRVASESLLTRSKTVVQERIIIQSSIA